MPSFCGVKARWRMAAALELESRSFRGLARRHWKAFSTTVIGDIIATAIAITGMSLLFLGCSFAVVSLTRMGADLMRLVGG